MRIIAMENILTVGSSNMKSEDLKYIERRLENLQDLQILINTTATQLISTRTQCDVNFEFIQQQLRTLEGKIVKYISQQLLDIVEAIPPKSTYTSSFGQYPKLDKWLEVVGMRSATVKDLCDLNLPLQAMLNMNEEEMQQMLNDVQCNDSDGRRFIAAMKNLRLYMEMTKSGEFTSTSSFYWNSWTCRIDNENIVKMTSEESNAGGRNRSVTAPVLTASRRTSSTAGSPVSDTGRTSFDATAVFSPTPSSYVTANLNDHFTCTSSPATPQMPVRNNHEVSDMRSPQGDSYQAVNNARPSALHRCQSELNETGTGNHNAMLQIIVQHSDGDNEIQQTTRSDSLSSSKAGWNDLLSCNAMKMGVLTGSCEALVNGGNHSITEEASDYSTGSDNLQKLRARTLSHTKSNAAPALVSMGHSIKHRFSHMPMFIAQACDYCNRIVVMGLKCKECKYKCHSRCSKKAPPSCGLPHDYEEFFKQQFLNDEYESTSTSIDKTLGLRRMNSSSGRLAIVPPKSLNLNYTKTSPKSRKNNQKNNAKRKDNAAGSKRSEKMKNLIPQSAPATSVNNCFNFSTPTDSSIAGGHLTESMSTVSSGQSSPVVSKSVAYSCSPPISSNAKSETSKIIMKIDKVSSTPVKAETEEDTVDSGFGVKECGGLDTERSSENDYHSNEEEAALSEDTNSCRSVRKNILSMRSSIVSEWIIPYEELKVKEVIGMGHFGRVHRGHWHGDVAIKFFNVNHLTEEVIDAFKLEVATFRKTRHDNLVLFMGACMKPPQLAIITSLCRGPSLSNLIHEQKERFSSSKILLFAKEICQGMSYLHSRGIIHKDLKSGNVFCEKSRVVITDFGVSSLVDYNPTQQERNLGCWVVVREYIVYFAPEIIKRMDFNLKLFNLTAFTVESDIYAFGTILFEMMAGQWPFSELPIECLIWLVGTGKQPSLKYVPAPQELKEILLSCWRYDPNKRETFSMLLKVLDKLPRRYLQRSPSCPSNSFA